MKNSLLSYSIKLFVISYLFSITSFLIAQEDVTTVQEDVTAAPDIGDEIGGLEKPIISEEYVLMPGDKILITITGATNYTYRTGITYEGKVTVSIPVTSVPTAQGVYIPKYDIVDAIPIHNLSLKAARDSLKNVFSTYFRNIDINLTLIGMRRFTVFVAGEVKSPGMVSAWPVDRVSTIIKKAKETTTLGTRSKIELRRNGEIHMIVNLEEFEKTGSKSFNPYVKDGDLVYVPKMDKSVIVRGAVFGKRGYELRVAQLTASRERTSEGIYELLEGEKILDLIDKAGGLTPWADAKNIYVKRNMNKIMVDYDYANNDEGSEENIFLEDGDVVVVPSVNAIVYVQGQVVSPGSFTYQPNLRPSDYIGLAGGPQQDAYLAGAYVQRGKKRIPAKKDPIIEEGDRIYVPRQIFKFWQDYVQIGAVVASLLISYLTLTAQ